MRDWLVRQFTILGGIPGQNWMLLALAINGSRDCSFVVVATVGWMAPMFHIRFLILVMALTVPAWSSCQAVGSFQTKPAFPKVVTAGVAPTLPTITIPNMSARDLVGGCGRGRVHDHQTHGCRGPADIR
jgi:hypothetical protein